VNGLGTNWAKGWPRHEWEFQLYNPQTYDGEWIPIGYWDSSEKLWLNWDYLAENDSLPCTTYRIRKPLPHINVLSVRNRIEATDSYIQFVSAIPPESGNPLGTRYWRWVSKGFAWTNLPADRSAMYGYAVALENPLSHYFNDTPYVDGTTWNDSTFVSNPNALLDPLSRVEDRSDQLTPIDGVMGNPANGSWDGDKRLATTIEWSSGHLNPFDIDGDGFVELPTMSDPSVLDPLNLDILYPGTANEIREYSIYEVRRHTITHEIGHALGGPGHTDVPACLMYKYTKNWSRDGYLSDDFKSRIRIHNITR
jgi:hypothetical protein